MTDISQGSDNTLPPAPPPVTEADIKAAVALAPTLDPSMAEAIYAGNTAIIAAIAQGANTDDDIAEQLINMGITTGLPPGIQQIIDQQLEEMNAKREAGNGKLLGAGEAVLAAAVGEHWSMDVPGEGGEEKPSWHGKDIDEMDFGQKLDYLNALEDMSFAQYAAQTDAERKKNNENVTKDAQSKLEAAEHDKAAFEEKMKTDPSLGNTPEERAANRAKIDAATNINLTGDEAKAAIEALPPELQAAAEEQRRILRNEYYSKMALEAAEAERKALERGDIEAAHRYAQDAAGYMRADHEKDKLAQENSIKAGEYYAAKSELTAADKSDLKGVRLAAEQAKLDMKSAYSVMTDDEREDAKQRAAQEVDSGTAMKRKETLKNKAVLAAKGADGNQEDFDAEPALASVQQSVGYARAAHEKPLQADGPVSEPVSSQRLTIDGRGLAAAGLDQLGATAPANDAVVKKPEPPKLAQSSPGVSA